MSAYLGNKIIDSLIDAGLEGRHSARHTGTVAGAECGRRISVADCLLEVVFDGALVIGDGQGIEDVAVEPLDCGVQGRQVSADGVQISENGGSVALGQRAGGCEAEKQDDEGLDGHF